MNKNNTPTAYLLCGFIGSGKTTYAKKLEKDFEAIRFTKDEWMVKIFGNNPQKEDNFVNYDGNMTKLTTEIALKCLRFGISVVIDDGFWYREQRNEIRKQIKEIGAITNLYYMDTPVEVMKSRTIKRSENPSIESFYITEEEFNNYLNMFEPPSLDEEFITIKN